jgi:hypothetical protein
MHLPQLRAFLRRRHCRVWAFSQRPGQSNRPARREIPEGFIDLEEKPFEVRFGLARTGGREIESFALLTNVSNRLNNGSSHLGDVLRFYRLNNQLLS